MILSTHIFHLHAVITDCKTKYFRVTNDLKLFAIDSNKINMIA